MYHGDRERHSKMVGREEVLAARPDLAPIWEQAYAEFPVHITRSFWERTDPRDPSDPLAIQALPDARELEPAPGDLLDPVGDRAMSPVPWVVRKYRDRALWLLTKRCHLYCRYCFRRDHSPGASLDPSEGEWQAAISYLRGSGAREVILSGGDPLVLPKRKLFAAIDALRPDVPRVRIHTRAPITFPEAVTPDLVEGLRARSPLWMVVHCNHPRELAADVRVALGRLVDGGIPVFNQAVLLRGVNDSAQTLADLCESLAEIRVKPYYLHVTDKARGNAHLRVDLDEAIAVYQQLKERVGGLALPRLVLDPPDGSGKVDAERWGR